MNNTIAIRQNNIYLSFKEINKKDIVISRKEREDKNIYVLTSNPNMARTPKQNHPWKRNMVVKEYAKTGHFN